MIRALLALVALSFLLPRPAEAAEFFEEDPYESSGELRNTLTLHWPFFVLAHTW